MMGNVVTDPALLAILNADEPKAVGKPVTDPALLAQLNAEEPKTAAPAAEKPSIAADVAKSAGIGLVKGGLGIAGMLGDLTDLGATGIEKLSNPINRYFGLQEVHRQPQGASIFDSIPGAADLQRHVEGVTGEFYKPKTIAGEYAQTAGEFAPALIGGPESLAAKIATRVAVPALASETAGQLTKGTAAEPYARIAGAVLSPLAASSVESAANAINGRVEGMSRAAGNHLVKGVQADGPAAVQARLEQLGPDAMLADGGPAMLGTAQGAAGSSLEARSALTTPLKARDLGTDARIAADVEHAVGPYHPQFDDPQTVTDAVIAHRKAIDNVNYPAALENAPSVDIAPVLQQIDARIAETPIGSMEHKALTNARAMMMKPQTPENVPAAPVGRATAPAPVDAAADLHARNVADIRAKFGDDVAAKYDQQNRPAGPAKSLLEFIASKGGLAPHPELDVLGLTPGRIAQFPGQRAYGVLNKSGTNLDRMREAAQEAGYLRSPHPDQTTTTRDFLDAIDNELRGQKTYPEGFEGTTSKRENVARSEREQHDYNQTMQGFEDDLRAAGHGEHGPEVRQRAIQLMASKGMDADTAVDHAVSQLERESSGFPGDRPAAAPASAPAPVAQGRKPIPQDSAHVLHKIKGELDQVIEYDAPGLGVPAGALQHQQGSLKQVRGALNAALEQQVPGYANANAVSAALAQRAKAVEAGTQVLSSGKTAPSPGRFAADFVQREPGERIALAKGLRGEIERILGQNPNDLAALRRQLQGGIGGENGVGGGWNTAKIATVFGQPAANELDNTVTRNTAFRETHQKISEGAQTDIRKAAREEFKPTPATEIPLINSSTSAVGLPLALAKKGVQHVVNALTNTAPSKSAGEVARALTEQGAARDARLMAVVNAINKRQQNSAITAGGRRATDAVTAALLAHQEVAGKLQSGRSP